MGQTWYPAIDYLTCADKCPNGAITYVSDDSGSTPPHGEAPGVPDAPCCCASDTSKTVSVEYLYLDLKTCGRCIGTDNLLDEVMETLLPVLELAGYKVQYQKIEMSTLELAEQYRFLSSPTIRINGKDMIEKVTETACGCCSEISGTDTACRAYEYEGKSYEVPPKEMLAKAILTAVFGADGGCSCASYELPENLKRFYEGKNKQNACSCGGKC